MNKRSFLAEHTQLADYRIIDVLGSGGFGVTYKALDVAQNQVVAIKEYYPADLAVRDRANSLVPHSGEVEADYRWGLGRFLEEARTLALFRHPSIVQVRKLLQLNNTAYMVLAFEQGGSFRHWLRRLGRPPTQAELDNLTEPLLNALELIHANGMLHRDISPDNIIIRQQGPPVLIDFGSARQAVGMRGAMSAIVKHGFSPQEQYASDPSKQGPFSDIYAFAATLYYALTGQVPPQSMSRIDQDTIRKVVDLSRRGYRPGFLEAVDSGLAVHPRARPQTVQAWRQQLSAGREPQVVIPFPTPAGPAPAPPPPLHAYAASPDRPGPVHQVAQAAHVAPPVPLPDATYASPETKLSDSGGQPLRSGASLTLTRPTKRTRNRNRRAARTVFGIFLLLLALACIVGFALVVVQAAP